MREEIRREKKRKRAKKAKRIADAFCYLIMAIYMPGIIGLVFMISMTKENVWLAWKIASGIAFFLLSVVAIYIFAVCIIPEFKHAFAKEEDDDSDKT